MRSPPGLTSLADAAWHVVFFKRHREDDRRERCPAEEFLRECPDSVATDFFSIIDDVAAAPPPRFSGGGMWESMHGKMGGIYEARVVGPGKRLYRLFCVLERPADGLPGPSIVLLTGMWKPAGTTFTENEYGRVRKLRDEYRARLPRSVE